MKTFEPIQQAPAREGREGAVHELGDGAPVNDLAHVDAEVFGPAEPAAERVPAAVSAEPPAATGPEQGAKALAAAEKLIAEAVTAAVGLARRDLADAINDALEALPKAAPPRAVARLLSTELDSGRLEGLADARGRTCRSVAAETLISLGYPFALEVTPDDLDHLRADTARPGLTVPVVAGLGMVSVTAALELSNVLLHPDSYAPVAIAQAGVGMAAAAAASLTRLGTSARKWSLAVLMLSGLEGIGLGLVGPSFALLSGIGALMAFVLFSQRR